jgi:uncharacterized membrane protein
MRKYFTSGLAILLPLLFTLMIVNFLINFITDPFLESATTFIEKFDFFHQATLINFSSKLLILFLLTSLVFLIGLLGRYFFMEALFHLSDYLFQKLPIINRIYQTFHDIVYSLFSSSSKKFSQVVFVPFPSLDNLCMGLVTSDCIQLRNSLHEYENWVSVFIPATPNPSVGFLLMFRKEQLLFVDMKVDEAMKFVVSCGVVMPDFEIIQPDESYEKKFCIQSPVLSCEG